MPFTQQMLTAAATARFKAKMPRELLSQGVKSLTINFEISRTSSFDAPIVFLLEYVQNSQTRELRLPIWGGKADRHLRLSPLSVVSREDM